MWKKESYPFVLLATAVVFVVLVVIKITCLLEASARAQNVAKKAAAQHELSTQDAGKTAADSRAVVEQLKKHNLFAPPRQPRHPVSSVLGILGNEALIGNRWYKVGDNIADAEVVCVEPTHVRVRWQGRETVLAPMQMASQVVSGGSRPALRDLRQANQGRMLGERGAVMVRSGRTERSQAGRSARLLAENKANGNEKADKK
ncbi:MAG: hypothetical protein ACYTAO_14275 [Planctomycetota bacterium]|jgi:hypothetical protein